MSINFKPTIDWIEILREKKEQAILVLIALPFSILYKIQNPFGVGSILIDINFNSPKIPPIVSAIALLGIEYDWGLFFGFFGGLVTLNLDMIERVLITYIWIYPTFIIGSIVFLGLTGHVIGYLSVILLIIFFLTLLAGIGFIPGFVINRLIYKLFFEEKKKQKDIEEKDYVNYQDVGKL